MLYGTLLAIGSGTGFALLGILGKLAYGQGLSPQQALLCRFVFGSGFLLLALLPRPRLLRLDAKGVAWAALLGMVFYCLQSSAYFMAIQSIPVSTTTLIVYCAPACVALLEWLTGRAKPTPQLWGSLALIMGGCALVCADAFGRQVNMQGLAGAVATMASYSLYLYFSQAAMRGRSALSVTLYVVLFAALGFLLLYGIKPLLAVPASALPTGLALGLFPTALAIALLFMAVERVGSAYAALGAAIEPAVAMIFAALLLGEHITLLQVAGAGLILAGIALPQLQQIRASQIITGTTATRGQ